MQDLDVDLEEDAEGLKNIEVYKSRQVTQYEQRTNTTTLDYLESKINKNEHEVNILKKYTIFARLTNPLSIWQNRVIVKVTT